MAALQREATLVSSDVVAACRSKLFFLCSNIFIVVYSACTIYHETSTTSSLHKWMMTHVGVTQYTLQVTASKLSFCLESKIFLWYLRLMTAGSRKSHSCWILLLVCFHRLFVCICLWEKNVPWPIFIFIFLEIQYFKSKTIDNAPNFVKMQLKRVTTCFVCKSDSLTWCWPELYWWDLIWRWPMYVPILQASLYPTEC